MKLPDGKIYLAATFTKHPDYPE